MRLITGVAWLGAAWTGCSAAPAARGEDVAADLIAAAQPVLEAAVRQQAPAAARGQLHMQWSWSAPRGAAAFACASGWQVHAAKMHNLARMTVPVSCEGARGSVVAKLTLHAPVWTLVRDMPAQATVHAADLRQQVQAVRSLQALLPAEMLYGTQLRKASATGTALQLRDVERPALLQRGDKVEIRASDAGVSVHVAGEALGSARLGDAVRVRNARTQKVLEGRLVEPGVVLIEEAPATGSVKVLSESSD